MADPNPQPSPITKEDLQQLPRWAIVAFAARCARRVQPLFARCWNNAPRSHVDAIDKAISMAEAVAEQGTQFTADPITDYDTLYDEAFAAYYDRFGSALKVDTEARAFAARVASARVASARAAAIYTAACTAANTATRIAAIHTARAASAHVAREAAFYSARVADAAARVADAAARAVHDDDAAYGYRFAKAYAARNEDAVIEALAASADAAAATAFADARAAAAARVAARAAAAAADAASAAHNAHDADLINTVYAAASAADNASDAVSGGGGVGGTAREAEDAARADYAMLQRLARDKRWTNESPVDVALLGPLWPEGTKPQWA